MHDRTLRGDWIIVDLGPERRCCSHGRLIKFSAIRSSYTYLPELRRCNALHCSAKPTTRHTLVITAAVVVVLAYFESRVFRIVVPARASLL